VRLEINASAGHGNTSRQLELSATFHTEHGNSFDGWDVYGL
jgi:hypothetical protein